LIAESLLAAIVESSSDAIVGKALDGTILTWNAAAERIFGFSSGEMVGQSIRRIIPPARLAEEDAIIAAISAGQRVETFETVRLRKDGSEGASRSRLAGPRETGQVVLPARRP
jgi:PAS domain S-box-containing protein